MQRRSGPPGDALVITHLMFDLCSAPCKARRVAPPAHARGLRALTVPPRSSEMGNCMMAGGVMTCNLPILSIDRGSKRRYSVVISPVQHAPLPRGTISRGTLNVVALRATTHSSPESHNVAGSVSRSTPFRSHGLCSRARHRLKGMNAAAHHGRVRRIGW
jgi:hypothetical protein